MGGGAQKPLLFRSFPYERFPEVDSLHQGCTNLHSVGEGIIAEIHKVIPILIAVNPFGIDLTHAEKPSLILKNEPRLQSAAHSESRIMVFNCINPCQSGLIFIVFASCFSVSFEKCFGSHPALAEPKDRSDLTPNHY